MNRFKIINRRSNQSFALDYHKLEDRKLLAADSLAALDNLDGHNGFVLQDEDNPSRSYVQSIGDVNGDGFDDLGYRRLNFDITTFQTVHEAGILFGRPEVGTPLLGFDDQAIGDKLVLSESRHSSVGAIGNEIQIRGLGDLNNDGIDDFAVYPQFSAGVNPGDEHGLYVVWGDNDRLLTDSLVFDLSDFSADNGVFLKSGSVPSNGIRDEIFDVVGGDIDGDGFGDLHVVWAAISPGSFGDEFHESWVDTYYGVDGGFATDTLLSSNLTSDQRVRYQSDEDQILGTFFVWHDQTIDFGGDLNGDGSPDLAIGGSSNVQRAEPTYVVFGGTRQQGTTLDLTRLSPGQGLAIFSPNYYAGFSPDAPEGVGSSLEFVGDVTGDGIDDLVVGSWQGTTERRDGLGGFYLVKGNATRWDSVSSIQLNLAPSSEVTEFVSSPVVVGAFRDGAGHITSVSAAGDLNGDGFNDFAIVAAGDGATRVGNVLNARSNAATYVIFGGPHLANAGRIARHRIDGAIGIRHQFSELGIERSLSVVHGDFDFDGDGSPDLVYSYQCGAFGCIGSESSFVVLDPLRVSQGDSAEISVRTPGSHGEPIYSGVGSVRFATFDPESDGSVSELLFLGDPAVSKTIEVHNQGQQNLVVQPAEFVSDAGVFEIVNNFSPGTSIAPGEFAELTIALSPNAAGIQNARIVIPNSDSNEALYEFEVFGEVNEGPLFRLYDGDTLINEDQNTVDFGTLNVSEQVATRTLRIANEGTDRLFLPNFNFDNGSNGFLIVRDYESVDFLLPGESVVFELGLIPSFAGPRNATAQFFGLFDFELTANVVAEDPFASVTSIVPIESSPPTDQRVSFLVNFSAPISGLAGDHFSVLSSENVQVGNISVNQVEPSQYVVSINEVQGSGEVRLRFEGGPEVLDSIGRRLLGNFDVTNSQSASVSSGSTLVKPVDILGDGSDEFVVLSPEAQLFQVVSPDFSSTQTYPLAFRPRDFFAGDINSDGIEDIVFSFDRFLEADYQVAFGQDDGSYFVDSPKLLPDVVFPRLLGLVDVNLDGDKDLVYRFNFVSSDRTNYLANDGSGTFNADVEIQRLGSNLQLADFFNMGDQTLASTFGSRLATEMGDIEFEENITDYAIADFDFDGRSDVAVVHRTTGQVVLQLTGHHRFDGGVYGGPRSAIDVGGSPEAIVVSDLNKDGNPDLLISYLDDDLIGVLFGEGDGQFGELNSYETQGTAVLAGASDVNSDGRLDLVYLSPENDSIFAIFATEQFDGPEFSIGTPSVLFLDSQGQQITDDFEFNFGDIDSAIAAPTDSITVRNNSDQNVVLQPAQIPTSQQFQLIANASVDQILMPGASFTFVFQPVLATAGEFVDSLILTTNAPQSESLDLTVASRVHAPQTFVVTNTANLGFGSLRDAILQANAHPSSSDIVFDIPVTDMGFVDIDFETQLDGADAEPDVYQINLSRTDLPIISNEFGKAIRISGDTGSETNPHGPEIVINGSDLDDGIGLWLASDNASVEGLVLHGFSESTFNVSGNFATVARSFIGIDATGQSAVGGGEAGINITGSDAMILENTIGGFQKSGLNNTGHAIRIFSENASVARNKIGTSSLGTSAIPNNSDKGAIHVIGGRNARIFDNLISGNNSPAIFFEVSEGGTVTGNTIGLAIDGSSVLANTEGIVLDHDVMGEIVIGGAGDDHNLISGNTGNGILFNETLFESKSSSIQIIGNYIGVDRNGAELRPNGGSGISLAGGEQSQASVVVSGNTVSGNLGIGIEAVNLLELEVSENFVGVNAQGDQELGNGGHGILIASNSSFVSNNLISGNDGYGVWFGNYSEASVVQGNVIGLNASMSEAIGNLQGGIHLSDLSAQVTVGVTNNGNVISGNLGHGISTSGLSESGHIITSNLIGTNLERTVDFGNEGDGIFVSGEGVLISANVIKFNEGNGVSVGYFSAGIQSNDIDLNGKLGIDLNNDGSTENDRLDVDNGPNGLQNFPIIESVVSEVSGTEVSGRFQSTPDSEFTIQFFASNSVELTESIGGEFVRSITITTDSNGEATFFVLLDVEEVGFITATALKDSGETSEFSPAVGFPVVRPFLLGDADLSGAVDFADIPAFIDLLIGGDFLDEADVNRDGIVDFSDIPAFIQLLINGGPPQILLGDADLSGVVDFADIPAFIELLQSGTYLDEADIDRSGVVDFADIPAFIDVLISGGSSAVTFQSIVVAPPVSSAASLVSVAEPESIALVTSTAQVPLITETSDAIAEPAELVEYDSLEPVKASELSTTESLPQVVASQFDPVSTNNLPSAPVVASAEQYRLPERQALSPSTPLILVGGVASFESRANDRQDLAQDSESDQQETEVVDLLDETFASYEDDLEVEF